MFDYNMSIRLSLLLGLAVALNAISLTVSSLKERCMIVSSNNNEHLLKTDLKFQRFSNQALEEGYRVVLHNTQTHEEQAYQIAEGTFRKEFQLTQNVVYKFCFKIVLTNFREIRATMQYNADITHRHIEFTNITIPEGLLKVQDLQETYRSLRGLELTLQEVTRRSDQTRKEEDLIFNEQNQNVKTLALISIVEIAIVCVFGGYQYFRLKAMIQTKQN